MEKAERRDLSYFQCPDWVNWTVFAQDVITIFNSSRVQRLSDNFSSDRRFCVSRLAHFEWMAFTGGHEWSFNTSETRSSCNCISATRRSRFPLKMSSFLKPLWPDFVVVPRQCQASLVVVIDGSPPRPPPKRLSLDSPFARHLPWNTSEYAVSSRIRAHRSILTTSL